jgi:adrenodoxin-NADP+ reductase
VVTSLGFHAEPVHSEIYDAGAGHLRNVSGRVVSAAGETLRNVYASGWAATGAKGVLASTMMNAYSVADTIVGDWEVGSKGRSSSVSGLFEVNADPRTDAAPEEVEKGLKDRVVFEYRDWDNINSIEILKGSLVNKERERFRWEEAKNLIR